MRRGLVIIPGGLLAILLSAGTLMAAEPPCPTTQTSPPRLFLQTDNLKTLPPMDLVANVSRTNTYRLDRTLVGDGGSSQPAKANSSPVELSAETDMAALHIKTDGAITPYVGAGLSSTPEPEATPGISEFEAEREADRQSYLLGAGLACDLSHSARLNLGYRYSAGNLPELSGSRLDDTGTERDDHHISFGLKLDF